MCIFLKWWPNPRASCLYAAAALAAGRSLADARLASALAGPAAALATRLTAAGVSPEVWRQLVPLAAMATSPAEFVQVSLSRQAGQVAQGAVLIEDTAALVIEVQRAVSTLFPRLAEELELRSRPLREQWEARAPGLWRELARLTAGRPLVNEATVLLVQPACGGGGTSYNPHNAVGFEAVLANPIPQLPEVLRLGWLLAQLSPGTSAAVDWRWAVALIPATLAAAESVELARCDEAMIRLALETWCPELPHREMVGPQLAAWWAECGPRTMNWEARLAPLEEYLPQSMA